MASVFFLPLKSRWTCRFSDAAGARRQRLFRTEAEAKRFARGLASELAIEAVLPMGAGEREQWRRLVRAGEAVGLSPGEMVGVAEKAVRAWVAPKKRTLAEAVEAFLDDTEGRNLRPKTSAQYRQVLGRLAREHVGLRLDEVTGEGLAAWVCRLYSAEASRATTRTRLVAWARWCAAPPRGWVALSLAEGIRWQKARQDERRIEFLTGQQVAALLAAATPEIRPGLVLMAFAGVRPYEAARLTWEEVNWSARSILIPGAVAKTRVSRRLHQLPDNLWAWLALTPAEERTGPLISLAVCAAREHLLAARKVAGIARWPQDGLRHSFGTHGWWRGAEWVVATMGHVSGFTVLARHYRGCVGPEEARAYFEISPRLISETGRNLI